MGQEIVYCCVCQTRLLVPDFESREAFRIQGKPCCGRCVKKFIASLPGGLRPAAQEELAAALRPPPAPRPEAPPRKTTTAHIPKLPEPTPRRHTPAVGKPNGAVWIGAGLLGLVLVAAVAFSGSGGPERARPRTDVRPSYAPEIGSPTPRQPDPREQAAAKALGEAREAVKAHPEDFSAVLPLYEKAVWEARGTNLLAEAQREHQALRAKAAERLATELVPLIDAARAARRREEFARAASLLTQARVRHAGPDWTAPLDRESRELQDEEERLFASLVGEAEDARRRGDSPRERAVLDRVSRWGVSLRDEALRLALAAVKPPAVVSPETRRYRERWEQAMTRATVRAYAEALQELEGSLKDAVLPELRAEIQADLDLTRAVSALVGQALDGLLRSAKGRKVVLELETSVSGREKIEAVFERASGSSAELKKENDSMTVDVSDLSARTLIELAAAAAGAGDRAVKAFLLIEGETVPDASDLPAKLAEYAARLPRVFPDAKEEEARSLYAAAERDFSTPGSRVLSADAYASLLERCGSTRFVGRRKALLAARRAAALEAGRDYVLLVGDMTGAGAFQSAAVRKGEPAWTSQAEVPSPKDNYVELTFHALPSIEYRAWALVGGCCAETFAFFTQGTEMTAPHPDRPAERVSAEPGGPASVPGKLPTVFLRKLHSMHGGPKTPARYEWVPIALPRYATPGRKAVRILSGQQGFSVRCVVVSATREAPPAEADLKQIEKTRPAAPPTAARDFGLVAHWKFDEGKGDAAADSSGSGLAGALRNGPTWSAGRVGGALSFNGINQSVDVGNSPKLLFAGPFTVAAWVNPADVAGKYRYIAADYNGAGNQSSFALRITTGQAVFFWENPTGTHPCAQSRSTLVAGRWTHLAGVWDGTARKLYVNGILEATESTPQARPAAVSHVAIGRAGGFDGLFFCGEIDDVRLYSRALNDPEVSGLVRAAPRR